MVSLFLLKSCPHLHDAFEKLLNGNNSWINPEKRLRVAARILAHRAFLTFEEQTFIRCVNPEDLLDLPHITRIDCDNTLPLPQDFDENCDDLVCESCGRHILPITHLKKTFHLFSIRLNIPKIESWIEKYFSHKGVVWQKIQNGVYGILLKTHFFILLAPELGNFSDLFFKTDFGSLPVCFLLLKKTSPFLSSSLPKFYLSEMLLTSSFFEDLNKKLQKPLLEEKNSQGCKKQRQKEPAPFFQEILLKKENFSSQKKERKKNLMVRMVNGGICIEDTEVINKRARLRLGIFKILLTQYWSDFKEGKPPEQHVPLNLHQIAERLEDTIGPIEDIEQQVRRPLNKLQKNIGDILSEKKGMHVQRDDVIETLGRPGTKNKPYGYRLNPHTLFFSK